MVSTASMHRSFVSLTVLAVLLVCKANIVLSFVPLSVNKAFRPTTKLQSQQNGNNPSASLVGYIPEDERSTFEQALVAAGFVLNDQPIDNHHEYSFSRATGMLKLHSQTAPSSQAPPKWITLVQTEEKVLIANGWSFLDPDENEDPSEFATQNSEGQYQPKWGIIDDVVHHWSKLGFSLQRLSADEVQTETRATSDLTRQVLLEGATDPPHVKKTHNGYSFVGSVQDLAPGIFVCVVGGLPLFTTQYLSPSTASSGWLSFSQPVSDDHIQLIHPDTDSPDQRIEVVCAKTGCHLGHYFGKGNGYCINASVLNFVPATSISIDVKILRPQSWLSLEESVLLHSTLKQLTHKETVLLGAGCFWHVEFALRRLPGVVSTLVGYAGGSTSHPTYEQVCNKDTGHAEVVQVEFDPTVLEPRILFDSFLAIHDATIARAHGRYAQYRSCIFTGDDEMMSIAQAALDDCRLQVKKELSTEIEVMSECWPAEERHQLHDERVNPDRDRITLSVTEWLKEHGKRSRTVSGSATTLNSLTGM